MTLCHGCPDDKMLGILPDPRGFEGLLCRDCEMIARHDVAHGVSEPHPRLYIFMVHTWDTDRQVSFLVDDQPTAVNRLRDWLREGGGEIGAKYTLIQRPAGAR